MPRVAGRPDDPCDPRAPVQRKPLGGGRDWVAPRGRSPRQGSLGSSRESIRPNAGPCREGGLSSTVKRVRGRVTEVAQALRKSSKWSPRHPHV